MTSRFEWVDDAGVAAVAPGGVVLSCFPSAGLAATVAAHYMVQVLGLPRIGRLDSDDALPLAIVQAGQAQPPIRVYGKGAITLVVSEFPPIPSSARSIAEAILDGVARRRARFVLAVDGVVSPPSAGEEGAAPEAAVERSPETSPEGSLWAISAQEDPEFTSMFERARARRPADGVIGGVSGMLLLRGQARGIRTATLLANARAGDGVPDHRAAAALIEAIDRILPEVKIDTRPLLSQAEAIERALRAAMKSHAGEPTGRPSLDDSRSIYQ